MASPGLAKELNIRERIFGIYTKKESDFPDAEEYNAYLEMVEDIIYKLANDIDVVETDQQVRDYVRQQEEAAASSAVAATAAAAAAAYRPHGGGGAPAVQPQPLAQVQQDAEGKLVPQQRGALSRAQFLDMGRASGWSPDIPRRRALHEAFSTIFVF